MKRVTRSLLVLLCALGCAAIASASENNPWPRFELPAAGPARAIGEYGKGCLQGAVALPLDGAGYQIMRPSRRRFYGHPDLVAFIAALGQHAADAKTMLLIGDLSQPRGGRSNGGHSSHQTGLDVDIWYFHPKVAEERPLGTKQRERMSARSIVREHKGIVLPRWRKKVTQVLRFASEDERVARIFVHPIIKRTLCRRAGTNRAWLRKIRPWYGHDDHFHVRLNCPVENPLCTAQAAIPEGDGCGGALATWFDRKAQAGRERARRTYQQNVDEGRGWPEACEALLD